MNPEAGAVARLERRRIQVDFYFDLICPWCMIGKRQLERAIDLIALGYPDIEVSVRWKSLPLLPDMPREGVPFQQFYLKRLGSVNAVESRRRQIRDAGHTNGIRFDLERIERMPNTIAAHRLVEHAARAGGATLQSLFIDQLFDAYFLRGLDIGDAQVLADLSETCGIARTASLDLMSAPGSTTPPDQWLIESRRAGFSGVPGFLFGDRMALAGAQPPELLARTMLESLMP
ncbi:DsbA family oxidoreductase [Dyella sp. Tek66A03]|uniref:DsbA family oxidoreductase n=1 Tax=Dyella sp. Tek66A03 TaxID=3458298 RepID=UPI00403E621A